MAERSASSCSAGSTGDYAVDDFGFDARPHRQRGPAAAAPALRARGSASRPSACEHVPDVRRRAGRRQPLGHPAPRRADDRRSRCTTTTPARATCACSAPTWSSACRCRRARPQGRAHAGLQRRRRAPAVRRRARRRVARGLQGHRQAVRATATSCSASAAAASSRPRCAPACRSSRARSSGAEEIYPKIGDIGPLARLLGVPVLPGHADVPAARPARASSRCRRSGTSSSASRSPPTRYDAGAADDPMLVFNLTDQVRETIQQTLYRLLASRAERVPAAEPAGQLRGGAGRAGDHRARHGARAEHRRHADPGGLAAGAEVADLPAALAGRSRAGRSRG